MRRFESFREDALTTGIRLVALRSKALKLCAFVLAVSSIIISAYADDNSYMGGKSLFMYFTIQSNLIVGLIYFMEIFVLSEKKIESKAWFIVRFIGVVSISLTGIAFWLLLAPTLGSYAWKRHNLATHIIVPVISIIEFITNEMKRNKSVECSSFWGVLHPLFYVLFAGIGYAAKWEFSYGVYYPYEFLNWANPAGAIGVSNESPFLGCIWWIIILFTLTIIIGKVYILICKSTCKRTITTRKGWFQR